MAQFRAVFIPALEQDVDPYYSEIVRGYELAKFILDSVAQYTLHLHELTLMPDFSNIGYIEQLVDGEWIEFDD